MKKSELKAIIKECVKEALFEEGVLSEIIAEVAYGLTKAQTIMQESVIPSKPNPQIEKNLLEEGARLNRQKMVETKQRMLNAIGTENMKGVFEGTEPLRTGGNSQNPSAPNPMAGVEPNDAGVDISGLFNLAGNKWNLLK
jgi:hypothetical protein